MYLSWDLIKWFNPATLLCMSNNPGHGVWYIVVLPFIVFNDLMWSLIVRLIVCSYWWNPRFHDVCSLYYGGRKCVERYNISRKFKATLNSCWSDKYENMERDWYIVIFKYIMYVHSIKSISLYPKRVKFGPLNQSLNSFKITILVDWKCSVCSSIVL